MKKSWVYAAAIASAFASSTVLAQSILNSRHNLSTEAGSTTTEVCVFCHTPHGADTAAPAPLWNRSLNPDQARFTRYSSLQTSTLDGQEADVGSVSLACLSCHDGTQARDTVINAPGRGGLNGSLGNIGALTTTNNPFVVIGEDLTDDHPISIQYAGGACQNLTSLTPGAVVACDPAAEVAAAPGSGDPDFEIVKGAIINGQPQWWVDTTGFDLDAGASGGAFNGNVDIREKTDMLLYARTFQVGTDAGNNPITETGPSVECGSCHDPHEATERPVQFLRISNANSDVCLACHVK